MLATHGTGDLDEAIRHHRAGNISAAIDSYRRILTEDPDNAPALHLVGLIAYQSGQNEMAMELITKALGINPSVAFFHNSLGNVLRKEGKLDEAARCYRNALRLKPDYSDACNNLGMALQRQGRIDEAVAYYEKALSIEPDLSEVYNNLGTALEAWGDGDAAEACHRKALQLKPDYAWAYNNLGNVLKHQGKLDQAIASYQSALTAEPNLPDPYNNLGTVLQRQGKLDEALAYYEKALTLKPTYAEAHTNRGSIFHRRGKLETALDCYEQAIRTNPSDAKARFNKGLIFLLRGDLLRGWPEYEWRLHMEAYRSQLSKPRWDGSELHGRSILIRCEQGLGDTIQFIRYLPLVKARGGRIIVECPSPLLRLLGGLSCIDVVIEKKDSGPDDSECDVHIELLSLPGIFRTSVDDIPADIPYMNAAGEAKSVWAERLGHPGMKIGLVWAGSPTHENDSSRSLSLAAFAPLGRIPRITIYSLQKGPPAREAAHLPHQGLNLMDFSTDLHDFADTAAFISHLDLVISVDTAAAHLAGAMGKPVWTLLPFIPDWRWLKGREDSPWYPTMRLFRQQQPGKWDQVIERVTEELDLFIDE